MIMAMTLFNDLPKIKKIKKSDLKEIAIRFSSFPAISAPTALLNTSGTNLPVFLVSYLFGAASGGLFALVERVVLSPVTLLAASFSNVYVGEMAKARRRDNGSIAIELFFKSILMSLGISAIVFGTLTTLSNQIQSVVFTDDWGNVSEIIRIFSVLVFFRIIATCVGRVFTVFERQSIAFFWNLARILCLALSLALSFHFHLDFEHSMIAYVCVSAVLDLINIILSYRVVRDYEVSRR